jgi:hypothetical protein
MELKVEQKRTWAGCPQRFSAWLMLDGKAVAWAVFEDAPEYGGFICLCDIETRPGFQGKGYARQIMSLIAENTGKPLATTGSFTPEGWKAFSGKLPVLPKYDEPTGPSYRSMTFVDDWDKFYAPS